MQMHDVFFVGRGIDYAISLEGSLKLKEISYIHSAYATRGVEAIYDQPDEPGNFAVVVY